MSFQIRFLHDPSKPTGYVGAALSSTMVRFFKKDDDSWDTEVSPFRNSVHNSLGFTLSFLINFVIKSTQKCSLELFVGRLCN